MFVTLLLKRRRYSWYQGRKASKASNTLFLADNQGQMIACSSPKKGNTMTSIISKSFWSTL